MQDIYTEIKAYFNKLQSAEVNIGKGAQGIKHASKMFDMFHKGDILLKFSPKRVLELIENGTALPHDPGTGTPMKDRVLIPASKVETWIDLTNESLAYVSKAKA